MGSFASHTCAPPGATVSPVCAAAGAGSAGPFLLPRDVPFLTVSWGTSMRRYAAEICKAKGRGGRAGAAAQAHGCRQAAVPMAARGVPWGHPGSPIPTSVSAAPPAPCCLHHSQLPVGLPGNRSPLAIAALALFIALHC